MSNALALDDDSSGSEFVPDVEDEDDDEERGGKRRKQDEPVVEYVVASCLGANALMMCRQLGQEDLNALWEEMNGGKGVVAKKALNYPSVQQKSPPPAGTDVDVNKLLAGTCVGVLYCFSSLFLQELASADKPELKTETVKFAGADVQVTVKSNAKQSGRPSNVDGIIDQLKGYGLFFVECFSFVKQRKTRRINTIEKSEIDWEHHKATDRKVGEEVEVSASTFVYVGTLLTNDSSGTCEVGRTWRRYRFSKEQK